MFSTRLLEQKMSAFGKQFYLHSDIHVSFPSNTEMRQQNNAYLWPHNFLATALVPLWPSTYRWSLCWHYKHSHSACQFAWLWLEMRSLFELTPKTPALVKSHSRQTSSFSICFSVQNQHRWLKVSDKKQEKLLLWLTMPSIFCGTSPVILFWKAPRRMSYQDFLRSTCSVSIMMQHQCFKYLCSRSFHRWTMGV